MSEMGKVALDYLRRYGFSVIPVVPSTKKPLVEWEIFQSRYPTKEEIGQWWAKYPDSMIGVVTGKLSNLNVVDVDTPQCPQELKDILGDTRERITSVATPGGGTHFYFNCREGVRNTTNLWNKKVDIRGEGGYVVVPPSTNGTGKEYKWKVSLANDRPEFPEKLVPLIQTKEGEKPITRDHVC